MKKLISMLVLVLPAIMLAAQSNYDVVFDLSSKDTTDQQNVVRWIKSISESNAGAKLEVVLYGQALNLVVKDKSTRATEVMNLAAKQNVSFKVCAIAMKAHNINSSELLAGVQVIPDGIYEIITKQREGWGYIKVKN